MCLATTETCYALRYAKSSENDDSLMNGRIKESVNSKGITVFILGGSYISPNLIIFQQESLQDEM